MVRQQDIRTSLFEDELEEVEEPVFELQTDLVVPLQPEGTVLD